MNFKQHKILREKIEYIIDNDGTELSDGYSGLESYLKYCLPQESEEFLAILSTFVEEDYLELFERIEEEECLNGLLFEEHEKFCVLMDPDTKKELFKIDEKLYTPNFLEVKPEKEKIYVYQRRLGGL